MSDCFHISHRKILLLEIFYQKIDKKTPFNFVDSIAWFLKVIRKSVSTYFSKEKMITGLYHSFEITSHLLFF